MDNLNSAIHPDNLRLPERSGDFGKNRGRGNQLVIRYPRFVNRMPLEYIATACMLNGKAVHVALAIWDLASLSKSNEVRLAKKQLSVFGVQRHSAYRALKQLEKAGLITVERRSGRAPRVTIDNRYFASQFSAPQNAFERNQSLRIEGQNGT